MNSSSVSQRNSARQLSSTAFRPLRPLRQETRDLCEHELERVSRLDPTRFARVLRERRTSRASVLALVLVLAQHASDAHGDCHPTQLRLSARLASLGVRLNETALRRALRGAEDLDLVQTLTGPDALPVYGAGWDRRANAYRVLPLVRAHKLAPRAPIVDRRTSSQRSAARAAGRKRRLEEQLARDRAARLGVSLPELADHDLFGMPWPARSKAPNVRTGLAGQTLAAVATAAATTTASAPNSTGRYLPVRSADTTSRAEFNGSGGHPFGSRLRDALEKGRLRGSPPASVPPKPPK